MAMTVTWDDPERKVLCQAYHADWTYEDVYAISPQVEAMLNSVSHTVDVILDMSSAPGMPNDGMGSMKHFSRVARLPHFTHPNVGLMVLVGPPKLVEMMAGGFTKAFNLNVRVASTKEEAYAIFAERV